MALKDGLIGPLDRLRGIPGRLGLRGFKVFVLVRRYSGSRVGVGPFTDAPLVQLTVAEGTQPCKVEQVSAKDVIRSGGTLTDKDLRVGPLTPPYANGGTAQTTLDPPRGASPAEVFYKVTHQSLPNGVAWFEKVSDEVVSLLHYYIVIRSSGRVPSQ